MQLPGWVFPAHEAGAAWPNCHLGSGLPDGLACPPPTRHSIAAGTSP